MIAANELRLNNWVKYDGRYFQIESVGSALPFLNTAEFGVGVVDYNNIQPIPLTEDILLKCGFECMTNRMKIDFDVIYCIIPDVFICCNKLGFWSIHLDGLFGYIIDLGKEPSLHRFQNIIHSITGEELKIEL